MKYRCLEGIPETAVSHNPRIAKRVMLSAGELGTIQNFAQAVFPPGECAPSHRHEDMGEVFFVNSGEGTIIIEGVEHPLEPGCCVVVEPGEAHEISNTGRDELVLTYFGVKL